MRKEGFAPINVDAEEPEAYRLFRLQEQTGQPLVAGGILDQPYVLNLELSAVRSGIAAFKQQQANMERIRGLSSEQPESPTMATQ